MLDQPVASAWMKMKFGGVFAVAAGFAACAGAEVGLAAGFAAGAGADWSAASDRIAADRTEAMCLWIAQFSSMTTRDAS